MRSVRECAEKSATARPAGYRWADAAPLAGFAGYGVMAAPPLWADFKAASSTR